jgi:peptide methionine sulfoxide reductase msrA/msrB
MSTDKKDTAIFAGGCFWGVQFYFDQVPGVLETSAGYAGGHKDHPSYEDVLTHTTGHAEAVKIIFDPNKVSYETLLKHFFRIHDPTQLNRQGPDVGDNYRSAVFYESDSQKKQAQKMIDELNKSKYDGKIVTKLEPAGTFWDAEDYHQKFTERTGRGACHVDYAPM